MKDEERSRQSLKYLLIIDLPIIVGISALIFWAYTTGNGESVAEWGVPITFLIFGLGKASGLQHGRKLYEEKKSTPN